MIDVSNSIASALTLSYRNNRLPSSVALNKPSAADAGGNSVRTLANDYRAQAGIDDFAPPPANAQGFASLSTALESLRIPPAALAASNAEAAPTPLWEKLLEEQKLIADARVERQQKFEDIQQLREDDAARRAANEQRAREVREAIAVTQSNAANEPVVIDDTPERLSRLAESQTVRPTAEPAVIQTTESTEAEATPAVELNLPGQGDNAEQAETDIETTLPGSGAAEAAAREANQFEPQVFPPVDENIDSEAIYSAEQERLSRLFFGAGNSTTAQAEPFNQFA